MHRVTSWGGELPVEAIDNGGHPLAEGRAQDEAMITHPGAGAFSWYCSDSIHGILAPTHQRRTDCRSSPTADGADQRYGGFCVVRGAPR
jgi:hypothetical protein